MKTEKLFDIYNSNDIIISKTFMEDFIFEYLEHNNLLNYVRDIWFTDKLEAMGGYNEEAKIMAYNYDLMIDEIFRLQKIDKITNNDQIIRTNRLIIKNMYHEITHVEQKRNIDKKINAHKLTLKYLKKSFSLGNLDEKNYIKYHDLYTLEYNANYESIVKLNKLLIKYNYISKNKADQVLLNFIKRNYQNESPLERFNEALEIKDNKIKKLVKVPIIEQISYGFPCEYLKQR